MSIPVGIQGVAHIFIGTRASWGTVGSNGIVSAAAPTLTPMPILRSVSMDLQYTEANGTTRASRWKLSIAALMEASIELEIPWQPTDATFKLLQNAYFGGTSAALAILDGLSTVSGSQGLWADFAVLAFPRDEPEDREMLSKVKLKPTLTAVPPQWVQVP